MTTRWPTATSENLAGLRSFVTYAVVAASFTSTDFPSSVFTVTDSGLIFSMVPMTCFLSPCAKAGNVTRTASKNTIQRRSEEHTSELQSLAYLVCRLLLEKKKK